MTRALLRWVLCWTSDPPPVTAMRFAYADPPYPGMANVYPEKTEVDHADLIARLELEYDGWALSTHVPGLRIVVPLLPERARICAWVKPWVNMRPGARLQYGWEPVIVVPARKSHRGEAGRACPTDRSSTGSKAWRTWSTQRQLTLGDAGQIQRRRNIRLGLEVPA